MSKILMVLKTQNLKNDQRVLKEIKSLEREGASVEVFVAKNCHSTEEDLGFKIKDISIVGGAASRNTLLQVLGVFQFYIKFIIFLFHKQIDKVWVCDPIMFGLILLLKMMRPNVKIIWDHHELPPKWFLKNKVLMRLFKKAYSSADMIIHTNNSRKEYLERELGIVVNYSYIISNYPEKSIINYEPLDVEGQEWLDKNPVFIYLQNSLQDNRYGANVVRAAIASGLKVFHAGKINERYLQEHNVKKDDIYLANYLNMRQINYVLNKCSFTIILYKANTLNQIFCDANRLYQAMTLGVPLIVGNNPTLLETTKDYKNCVVLNDDGGDVESIQKAIMELMSNISCRKQKVFDWAEFDWVFLRAVNL